MRKEQLLNLSMLVLRSVMGGIFFSYGGQKLFGMFNGIGLDGTAKLAEGLGFPNAYLIAVIWGVIEFGGGIFLVFGILARWSALAIVLTVVIKFCKISLLYGFFMQNVGVEYYFLIVGACVPIILLGGGSWSVWDA
ncbi:MAG: DoxX family protein [Candidatus Omnitrophota bacterium]